MTEFLADLFGRRVRRTNGHNSMSLGVTLNGGDIVEILPYEPDPTIYRYEYYYNSAQNILYKKILVQEGKIPPRVRLDILKRRAGLDTEPENIEKNIGTVAYWQAVSNPRIGY